MGGRPCAATQSAAHHGTAGTDRAASPSRDSGATARIDGSGVSSRRGSRPDAPRPLLRELGDASIQLRDRFADLLPAGLVRGQLELPPQLRAGKTERFDLARALGVAF